MVLTFTVILLGLLLLIPPLKKNSFYMVHAGLVILAAYYVENRWFTVTPFHPKTLLLFLVFQLASINLVTFVAYGVDKRAAQKGDWLYLSKKQKQTVQTLSAVCQCLYGRLLFHTKYGLSLIHICSFCSKNGRCRNCKETLRRN